MNDSYDVVVVGGGTAGTIAAIQAGRAGARTLLVEKNGILGGTITMGLVDFPALFYAWGKKVIAGIGWELVDKTLEETNQPLPDMNDPDQPHWRRHISISRAVFAALCDKAVLDCGVEMLLHAMVASAEQIDDGWRVQLCTKTGLRALDCKVLIDATGDANVASLAGLEVIRMDPVQPATLMMRLDGYDADSLDYEELNAKFAVELEAGRIRYTDVGWRKEGVKGFLRSRGGNCNHVTAIGAETSEGRTAAEVAGRQAMLRAYRFFKSCKQTADLQICDIACELGIRETMVIRGRETITAEDYMSGKMWPDAICYCFYPKDIHRDYGLGVDFFELPKGILPTIPRGALIPQSGRRFMAAGRCISGDRVAHSAYRVQAPCMATGQSAGAMAALTARTGVEPSDLPLQDVHALLREHGAIIPGDVEI